MGPGMGDCISETGAFPFTRGRPDMSPTSNHNSYIPDLTPDYPPLIPFYQLNCNDIFLSLSVPLYFAG